MSYHFHKLRRLKAAAQKAAEAAKSRRKGES